MKRIYLDMWAWIGLTDARMRGDETTAWAEVYDLAAAAVTLGAISFPLSSAHYMEVAKCPRDRRLELALTMAELSHWHAIVGPIPALVQSEISAELDRRFGPSPVVRTPLQIFGRGYGHIFRESQREEFARIFELVGPDLELFLLSNVILDEDEERSMRDHLDLWAGRFVAGEENFANVAAQEGISGEWLDDVARGTEFIALFDYLNDDLGERGMLNGALIRERHEKADLIDLLRQVPTAWNQAEMKRVQHADRGRRWRDNDHYDINPYSVALTYCDALAADNIGPTRSDAPICRPSMAAR